LARRNAMLDPISTQPASQELLVAHDAELPSRDGGGAPVERPRPDITHCHEFFGCGPYNSWHRTSVAGWGARGCCRL
jgi:hypothetical protein